MKVGPHPAQTPFNSFVLELIGKIMLASTSKPLFIKIMSKSVAAETAEITQSQNPPATTQPKQKSKRHSGARCSRNERHLADIFLNVIFVNTFRFSADVHIHLDFFMSDIPHFQLLVKSKPSFQFLARPMGSAGRDAQQL